MDTLMFDINFTDLSRIFSLRFDVGFFDPNSVASTNVSSIKAKHRTIKLRNLVSRISQGPSIRILDSAPYGDIGLVTIENIKSFSLEIDPSELHYVSADMVSESDLLKKNDILTPRVRGLGNVSLVKEGDKYISSENVLIVRFKEKALQEFEIKFLASYLSTFGKLQILSLQTGGKAGNINQELLKEVLIPKLGMDLQKEIVKKVEEIEQKIVDERKMIASTQDIIESVLIENAIKQSQYKVRDFESFVTDIVRASAQKFLRCGAQYRAFWDIHNGLLFDVKNNHSSVKLGSVIRMQKPKIVRKGVLNREYILVELENIEQKTGKLVNLDQVVTEIGSDKIEFKDADLLTTKLRPYLGYTFTNTNQCGLNLIGTTELLAFQVDTDSVYPDYIKYLLLTKEYIEKSKFLMYGKEHPRIHYLDLLNTRIPLPEKAVQEKVITEIKARETTNNTAVQNLMKLQDERTKMLSKYII